MALIVRLADFHVASGFLLGAVLQERGHTNNSKCTKDVCLACDWLDVLVSLSYFDSSSMRQNSKARN